MAGDDSSHRIRGESVTLITVPNDNAQSFSDGEAGLTFSPAVKWICKQDHVHFDVHTEREAETVAM
jgi:hypothetical protein